MIAKIIGVSLLIFVTIANLLVILVIIYDMNHDDKICDKYSYWFWGIFMGLILYIVFLVWILI